METNDIYLHTPDEQVLDGLVCFLDNKRPCDATCMAYTTRLPAADELVGQQGYCSVLVNMDRMGKHLVILASIMQSRVLDKRKEAQDRARGSQAPAPTLAVPRGR